MKHNYTSNFLIRYLYGETSILGKLEIENAIEESNSVKETFVELRDGFKMFPKVEFYPSDKTINAVLDYSKLSISDASC